MSEETALSGNPAWQALAGCQPRRLDGAMYSQLVAGLGEDEVLVARVAVLNMRRFHPQQQELACWVSNADAYNRLLHGAGARNQEIVGFYAVKTEGLMRLVFAAWT